LAETAFSSPGAAFIRQSLPGEDAMLQASFSEASMSLSERLKDPRLFRQQAFAAGAWVDADGGATVAVTDPATGAEIGTVPALASRS